MPIGPLISPLATGDADWMNQYGWLVLALVAMYVFCLYIWSYLSKTFEEMEAMDTKYIDEQVARHVEKMIKSAILILLAVVTLFVGAKISPDFKAAVWNPIEPYMLDFLLIVIIVYISMIIVQVLRRIARAERKAAMEERTMQRSALELRSLMASYIVYAATVVVILFIVASLIPGLNLAESLTQFFAAHETELGVIVVVILAIYFTNRFLEGILDDMKYRTKKFNPQVIDLFIITVKVVLWTIATLTILFAIFSIFGLELIGMILIVTILVFIITALALSYGSLRNIIAGLALMDASPFEVNDRINLNGKMECDVIQKNLMFTEVRTLEGDYVDVPNTEVIESEIYNYSRSVNHAITVRLQVEYSIPHGEVERIIKDAISKVDGIMKELAPEILAIDIVNNTILYEVRVKISDVMKSRRNRSDLIFSIQEAFHAAGKKVLFQC
jgi:small conductance mechanosensitive channel